MNLTNPDFALGDVESLVFDAWPQIRSTSDTWVGRTYFSFEAFIWTHALRSLEIEPRIIVHRIGCKTATA